jgi:hypothetical protein
MCIRRSLDVERATGIGKAAGCRYSSLGVMMLARLHLSPDKVRYIITVADSSCRLAFQARRPSLITFDSSYSLALLVSLTCPTKLMATS